MKKHIIVLLLIVCTVLTLAACRKEPASAYDLSGVVELRYLDIDSVCENDALSEAGEQLLGAVREDILLSFVADSSIEITKEELSGYDHLVFINPAWAERFCSGSELQELEYRCLFSQKTARFSPTAYDFMNTAAAACSLFPLWWGSWRLPLWRKTLWSS